MKWSNPSLVSLNANANGVQEVCENGSGVVVIGCETGERYGVPTECITGEIHGQTVDCTPGAAASGGTCTGGVGAGPTAI